MTMILSQPSSCAFQMEYYQQFHRLDILPIDFHINCETKGMAEVALKYSISLKTFSILKYSALPFSMFVAAK